jgi:hypothetical protein
LAFRSFIMEYFSFGNWESVPQIEEARKKCDGVLTAERQTVEKGAQRGCKIDVEAAGKEASTDTEK